MGSYLSDLKKTWISEQGGIDSRVCLLAEDVSAPRSFPAKSMRENFP